MHLSEDRIVTHESDTWIPQVELPRGSWHSNYGYINLWLHYLLEWIMFVQQHNRDGAGLSNSPWIFLCDTSQPPWGWVGTKCLVLANGCKQMCSVSLHLRSFTSGWVFHALSPCISNPAESWDFQAAVGRCKALECRAKRAELCGSKKQNLSTDSSGFLCFWYSLP